ncbi:hypothetical protein WICPIJ_006930 [Wickerhamomyces pijperi]|uniref:Proteasome assembly chaperone 2 n=1 Tax=Wickerhamomyces pijperi TaxID=599730 RepID=A0A9P8Q0V5_WICPI|nr:hypothetical protein WICPIJ_006930 [Wickerhamomyces pijperi]
MPNNISNTALLLPSIAHANVPQLTVDLILHTFPFVKVRSLDSTFLYPFASPVDHAQGATQPEGFSSALDLYVCEELGLSLIQQRAPVIPSFQRNFHSQLMKFIESSNFNKVVLLDSKDYAYIGGFMGNCPTAIYAGESTEQELDSLLRKLTINEAEAEESPNRVVKDEEAEIKDTFTDTVSQLVLSLKEKKISTAALIGYIYEGDNSPDAKIMAGKVAKLLSLPFDGEWKTPKSWSGVYGSRDVPRSMEDGMFG